MDKMNSNGLDLINLNLEKLKDVFPECFIDGKVDFSILQTLLGKSIEKPEGYKFEWVGKNECLKNALSPSLNTLRPVKEKSFNFETTENLYIEGDNFETLKTILKTYYNKIKMIYIDPPYNTGEDFVYEDDFNENKQDFIENTNQKLKANPSTSGRFHTNWLNMMYPRLLIAQKLLNDENGVIFISIDDNELTRLKMLCDSVFGEENFCAQISVKSNPGGRDYGGFAVVHDYLLVYTKTPEVELNMLDDADKSFPFEDEKGGFSLMELRNRNIKFNNLNRPNLYYPFYINPNNKDNNDLFEISLEKKDGWIELFPQESQGIKTVWRWGKEKASKYLNIEIKGKAKKDGGYQIVQKYRSTLKRERTIWDDTKYRNEAGSLALKALFDGKKPFDYPKSVDTILNTIRIGSDEDCYIMDFFSGSATTAEAVFKLNAEDGGKRKFILVQLPELFKDGSFGKEMGFETLCDAGEERIRRAAQNVKKELEQKKSSAGLFAEDIVDPNNIDFGFKVYKLDSTNIVQWDPTIKHDENSIFELKNVIKEDRSNLDVAYEVMLKYGIFNMPLEEIKCNGKTVYSVGSNYMIISLNDEITTSDVEAIAKLQPKAVVFKESGFADDNAKMNADYTFKRIGIDNVKCI